MKEMMIIGGGGMCTVVGSGMLYLCFQVMKQRDEIRQLKKTSNAGVEKEKEELVTEIEFLRNQCFLNPLDIKLLRRRALALNKMIHMYGRELCRDEALKMLKEAKSKLKKVLEADQDDHEAIFELGVTHYHIPHIDITLDLEKTFIAWKKAIKCFEKVGDKVPESYKGCNMMERLQNNMRSAPAVESEMNNKNSDVLSEPSRRQDAYYLDCEAAEIWNMINPDEVHSLRRWGTALSKLAQSDSCGYSNRAMKRTEWLEGAIEKLNKALLLEPDDINTKLELAEVRLFSCYGEEATALFEECDRLKAELSALSNSSSMVLNEMGHVAAVSEESSSRIAHSQTSIFNLRSPKEIESHHKYKNPHSFFPVEWSMRSGALGIPAAAMQIRGLRTAGFRSCGAVAPILRRLLHQFISRK